MSIWISALLFALGIFLVIKGGDWFVDASGWIARAANIPAFIVGATIVSIATTFPELIVSVMASLEGKNEMAVGNATGSIAANTGLILAIAMLSMSMTLPRRKYLRQCLILIATVGVLWAGSTGGTLRLWAIAALAALFLLFTATNILDARKEPAAEETSGHSRRELFRQILLFLAGAAGIVAGSNLLIRGGSDLAAAFGISERVIAVTMVAIGTSLPELVTTVTAIRKKQASLSVGNIIGANIIDAALILPVCSIVSGRSFSVSPASLQVDLPVCFLLILLAIVPIVVKEKTYRIQGALMLVTYLAYLALTI